MEIDNIITIVHSDEVVENPEIAEKVFEQFCIDYLKEKGYKILLPVGFIEI